MAWMWRDQDISTRQQGVSDFIKDMRLNQNGLIGTIYDDQITSDFVTAGLSPTPLTAEDIADLTGATPPIPASPSFKQLHDASGPRSKRRDVDALTPDNDCNARHRVRRALLLLPEGIC